MSMMWMKLPVGAGKPENKAKLHPFPVGPYIYVHQHDEQLFLKEFRTRILDYHYNFEFRWGYAVYVVGLDGEPMKVAYHYDTSD